MAWYPGSITTAVVAMSDYEDLQRRADPDNDWKCTGTYKWWNCDKLGAQESYAGCCAVNACEHRGSCPRRFQQLETLTKSPISTDDNILSSTETTTMETRTAELRTFVISTEPVATTLLPTTTWIPDVAWPPDETSAPSEPSEPKDTGGIIGGVIGGALGAIALVCVGILLVQRRKQILKEKKNIPLLGGLLPCVFPRDNRTDPDANPPPLGNMYAEMNEKDAPDKSNNDNAATEPKSPFPSENSTLIASPLMNKSPSVGSRSQNNSPGSDNMNPSSPTSPSPSGYPGFQQRWQLHSTPELPGSAPLPRYIVSELGGSPPSVTPPTLPPNPIVDAGLDLGDLSTRQSMGQEPEQPQGQPQELDQGPDRSELPVPPPPLTITTPEGVVMTPNLHTRQESHVMSFMQYPPGSQ